MKNLYFFKIGGVILFVLICLMVMCQSSKDGFETIVQNYPSVETKPLLQSYPLKNKMALSSSNRQWWHYPVLPLGTFKQITNNLKWFKNPDIATCSPNEFCGIFYKSKSQKETPSNISTILPPASILKNTPTTVRVGYFESSPNLLLEPKDEKQAIYQLRKD